MIPVYKPYLQKKILKYAHEALDSTWISCYGKYIEIVEKKLSEISECKYVITTSSGTTAVHLVAKALKLKHPEINKIIVPSNVFVAAWNMFIDNPIYELIPIESDIKTWNIDLNSLKETYELHPTAAFLVVHNMGNIINVPKIQKLYPNLVIIEDNCEGFFGSYESYKAGSKSLASSISFFGGKTITSGEGGAFCTNDENIANEIKRIKSQGVTTRNFVFSGLGYNYRMTNIEAAILYGQLEILDEILELKNNIFNLYKEELKNIEEIDFQQEDSNCKHSNWMFGIRVKDSIKEKTDSLKWTLYTSGIETRPMFPPINYHSHFSHVKHFEISKILYDTAFILPSFPDLTKNEIKYICKTIKDFFR
jgi:perosamine synthetase